MPSTKIDSISGRELPGSARGPDRPRAETPRSPNPTRIRVASLLLLAAVIGVSSLAASCGSGNPSIGPAPASASLGKIAYVDGAALWVKSLPDGSPRQVITESNVSAPKWSPTGRWLLYRRGNEAWVVSDDGSADRTIAGDAIWALVSDDLATGGNSVRTQHADGSGVRTLVAPTSAGGATITSFHDLSWSSNGHWLAYVERVVSNGKDLLNI